MSSKQRKQYDSDFDEYLARSYKGGFASSPPSSSRNQTSSSPSSQQLQSVSNKREDPGGKRKSGYSHLWKLAAKNLRAKARENARAAVLFAQSDVKSSGGKERSFREAERKRNPKLRKRAHSAPTYSDTSRKSKSISESRNDSQSSLSQYLKPNENKSSRARQRRSSYHGRISHSKSPNPGESRRDILRFRFSKAKSLSNPESSGPPSQTPKLERRESELNDYRSLRNYGKGGKKYGGHSDKSLPQISRKQSWLESKNSARNRSFSLTSLPGDEFIHSSVMLRKQNSLRGWPGKQSKFKHFLTSRSNSISAPSRRSSICQTSVGLPGSGITVITSSSQMFEVVVVGSSGTGKSELMNCFTNSAYNGEVTALTGSDDNASSLDSVIGDNNTDDECLTDLYCKDKCTIPMLLDGELSKLHFQEVDIDRLKDESMLVRLNQSPTQPDAYIVLYSVEDRASFQEAIDCLYALRMSKYSVKSSSILILAANKTDLVRTRVLLEQEGKSAAKSYEGKYIEISTAIDHNVFELLVGTLTLVRLTATYGHHPALLSPNNKGCLGLLKGTSLFTYDNKEENDGYDYRTGSGSKSKLANLFVGGNLARAKDYVRTKIFGKNSADKTYRYD